MFGLFIFLFTVVPAAELYLLFKVGAQIGGLNTILIILFTGVLGASLAKSQGIQILHKIQSSASRGELPADHIIQGLMVFAGGLLLLTPGFITDVLGFSFVLPGPRHLLLSLVKKMIQQSIDKGQFQFYAFKQNNNGKESGFYSYSQYEYNNSNHDRDDNVIEVEFREKE